MPGSCPQAWLNPPPCLSPLLPRASDVGPRACARSRVTQGGLAKPPAYPQGAGCDGQALLGAGSLLSLPSLSGGGEEMRGREGGPACTPVQNHLAPRLRGSAFWGSQKLLLRTWQGVPTRSPLSSKSLPHCCSRERPGGLGAGDRPAVSRGDTAPAGGLTQARAGWLTTGSPASERLLTWLGQLLCRVPARTAWGFRHCPLLPETQTASSGWTVDGGSPWPGLGPWRAGQGPSLGRAHGVQAPLALRNHTAPSEGRSVGGPAVLSPGSQRWSQWPCPRAQPSTHRGPLWLLP